MFCCLFPKPCGILGDYRLLLVGHTVQVACQTAVLIRTHIITAALSSSWCLSNPEDTLADFCLHFRPSGSTKLYCHLIVLLPLFHHPLSSQRDVKTSIESPLCHNSSDAGQAYSMLNAQNKRLQAKDCFLHLWWTGQNIMALHGSKWDSFRHYQKLSKGEDSSAQ